MTASTAPRALSSRLPWTHPLFWFAAISLAHVAMRLLASPALKWDEAEQILWTQELALGYGPQPPLYTWLQWAMNQVFGPSVLALSLLKHGLLALTYSLMYLAGRELLDERGAFWASASMVLMPALGWHSVRDQTHTILVTAMACGAWWLLLRIVRRPRPLDFASLAALCDVFFPRVWLRRARIVPAGTVSFTVYFHADSAQLAAQGSAHVLGQADAQALRNGFFDQTAQIWDTQGQLLATSHQIVYYKE